MAGSAGRLRQSVLCYRVNAPEQAAPAPCAQAAPAPCVQAAPPPPPAGGGAPPPRPPRAQAAPAPCAPDGHRRHEPRCGACCRLRASPRMAAAFTRPPASTSSSAAQRPRPGCHPHHAEVAPSCSLTNTVPSVLPSLQVRAPLSGCRAPGPACSWLATPDPLHKLPRWLAHARPPGARHRHAAPSCLAQRTWRHNARRWTQRPVGRAEDARTRPRRAPSSRRLWPPA